MLIFPSCIGKQIKSQKSYIAVEVSETIIGTHYLFISLSYIEGRDIFLHDTAKCNTGDTVIIKDYRKGLFTRRITIISN